MSVDVERLLQLVRQGDRSVLGPLLERYRPYLMLLARVEVGQRLQSKLDASDLVQETFLEAHRHIDAFQGGSEGQLVRWLRQILAGTLANLLRHYLGTRCRDVRLERELGESLDQSSAALEKALVAPCSSPSAQATHREQGVLLAGALATLPDDYREVIVLRHIEGLTFPEIARRMNRSQDSVDKLWLRGLARLRQLLGGQQETP